MAYDASGNYYDPATESANSGLMGYNPNGMTYTDNQPADPNSTNWAGIGSAIAGVGGVVNSINQPNATANGYGQVVSGINKGVGMINQGNQVAQGMIAPYSGTGQAVGNMVTGAAGGYQAGGAAGTAGLQQQASSNVDPSQFYNPGMAFSIQQGQRAMQGSAAARGGVINSGAMKDISSYITGAASQNYNQAAGLAMEQKQQQIGANTSLLQGGLTAGNQLTSMYGAGENAAANAATLQENASGNMAGGAAAAGNAQGQGTASGGSSTGNTLKEIGSVVGTVASIAALFSDRRLKMNIKRIGTHPIGIGIYQYVIAGKQQIGVMADEVKQVMPEAIIMHRSGFMQVDYNLIGGTL